MEGEEKKRRREEGRESLEAIDPFRKSKKVERTPKKDKKEEEKDTEMEEVKDMFRSIKNDTEEMRREIENLKEIMRIKEEKWEQEREGMAFKIRELERRMEGKEKSMKRNNVVIWGWKQEDECSEKKLDEWFERELGVKTEVQETYLVNSGKMIVAKMKNWEQKRKVMENKSKLRKLKGSRIFIDNDMTKKERGIQKDIREVAKGEKGKGKSVKVGYKKLNVDGTWYKWNEEEETMERI